MFDKSVPLHSSGMVNWDSGFHKEFTCVKFTIKLTTFRLMTFIIVEYHSVKELSFGYILQAYT